MSVRAYLYLAPFLVSLLLTSGCKPKKNTVSSNNCNTKDCPGVLSADAFRLTEQLWKELESPDLSTEASTKTVGDRVATLLSQGADPNLPNPANGKTALHLLAETGNQKLLNAFQVAELLDFEVKDARGLTPLDAALNTGFRAKLGQVSQGTIANAQYGDTRIRPFDGEWLADFPNIKSHVETEHRLHVKGLDEAGNGLTWQKEKFITKDGMDARLNPEMSIQTKIGYFVVPESYLQTFQAEKFGQYITDDVIVTQDGKRSVRLFVHPESYKHYEPLLANTDIRWVSPAQSEFMGTPTSSYRSWAVRRVEMGPDGYRGVAGSTPFIAKVGVAGSVLGSDRWLSESEVMRSVAVQRVFDKTDLSNRGSMELEFFRESYGVSIKDNGIANYPSGDAIHGTKKSGLLIREFPDELLQNKVQIVSMAALMSAERTKPANHGSGFSADGQLKKFPLIYEVIEASIKKGLVANTNEFMKKYMIAGYTQAIENLVFREGMTLEPHSQNLSMMLNDDLTPRGFVYRDHGGVWVDLAVRNSISKGLQEFHVIGDPGLYFKAAVGQNNYITSFSWFYRYQVLEKMLNVVAIPAIQGVEYAAARADSPPQIGFEAPIGERLLTPYIDARTSGELSANARHFLISEDDATAIRREADQAYQGMMKKYFPATNVQLVDGMLPAAESGSEGYNKVIVHDGFVGKRSDLNARTLQLDQKVRLEDLSDLDSKRLQQSLGNEAFNKLKSGELEISRFNDGIWVRKLQGGDFTHFVPRVR